jgi:hypothetical protein
MPIRSVLVTNYTILNIQKLVFFENLADSFVRFAAGSFIQKRSPCVNEISFCIKNGVLLSAFKV